MELLMQRTSWKDGGAVHHRITSRGVEIFSDTTFCMETAFLSGLESVRRDDGESIQMERRV